jgi:heme exporter protein A
VTPAIELSGLGRAYGDRAALRGVSLTVEPGTTLVVFGPNGAGKSTLLRILATLLRPTAGTARVFGAELPREAWKARGRIGLLGHEPLLYKELSARQNLRYQARLHDIGPERIEAMLDAVGLAKRADDPVSTYSRGMIQRAAVARAILHDPELLLLDEPRANLDPAASVALDPLLGGDPAHPRTRVITSHDPAGGLAEADVALGLKAGRMALLAPAAEVTVAQIGELYR